MDINCEACYYTVINAFNAYSVVLNGEGQYFGIAICMLRMLFCIYYVYLWSMSGFRLFAIKYGNKCYGTGCDHFGTIYTMNDADDDITMSVNTCGDCSDTDDCIGSLYFYCNYNYSEGSYSTSETYLTVFIKL